MTLLHGNGRPLQQEKETVADAKSVMPDLKISAKMRIDLLIILSVKTRGG
jgi:hypothetical protein